MASGLGHGAAMSGLTTAVSSGPRLAGSMQADCRGKSGLHGRSRT